MGLFVFLFWGDGRLVKRISKYDKCSDNLAGNISLKSGETKMKKKVAATYTAFISHSSVCDNCVFMRNKKEHMHSKNISREPRNIFASTST